jgi:group I intron endonuclease
MIGIYKITNPKGKVYVGQSIDINHRLGKYKRLNGNVSNQKKIYNSLIKYGIENHSFEIIEECSLEQLNEREIYYIEKYNSYKNGLNMQQGGKSFPKSEEFKEKLRKPKPEGFAQHMSKIMTGKKQSLETKIKKNNKLKKPITQLSIQGEYIRDWESSIDVSIQLKIDPGSLTQCLKGRIKSCGGFKWKYKI